MSSNEEKDVPGGKQETPETSETRDGHAAAPPTTAFPDGIDQSYFLGGKSPKKLPQWLDHFNARDLKILFKSALAVWIMTILIFINPTLNVIGQATFFGCIVLFIVPPSGVVFIHVLAGLTICIGLALGWAWGAITMKAALATRPAADLLARYSQLVQSMPQNTTNVGQASGQTTYSQIAIYNGFMLDPRVSVTYFCMMGLFVYLVARLRIAVPKLTLISMFAIIVADIYMTTAPLIPTFQGTIPKVMIIPVAIAVGIGMVCNLLVFPQSTSHIVVDGIRDIFDPMLDFVKALHWHLDNADSRLDLERLFKLKAGLAGTHKQIESSMAFLPMDFTYSRWSPQDIQSLRAPLRQVFLTFVDLLQLSITREEARVKDDRLTQAAGFLDDADDKHDHKLPVAYHQIARAVQFRAHTRHPDSSEKIVKTLNALSTCASPLMTQWKSAFDVVNRVLAGPSKSTALAAEALQEHQKALEELKSAQARFEAAASDTLIEPHAHLFNAEGNIITPTTPGQPPPLFGLVIGLLFQERILDFSKAITVLLERITEMESQRPRSRFWMPEGMQRIFAWSLSHDETPSTLQGTSDLTHTVTALSKQESDKKKRRRGFRRKGEPVEEPVDTSTAAARLREMRKPTGRHRHRISTICLAVVDWFTNIEGQHALRTLVLTVALAVPAVIPASAGFYYQEKGMWALIMAQMALVPYTSDFISGLLIRTAGTVAGGVIGLLCWYIGAGSGPGNPYGMAAIMAVVVLVMMWWRLFAPPEHMQAGIMLTSSLYLVVSYSWIDTHIPSYGNPGVGYNVFWRRLLLVIIGFAASMVVTLFPRPPSGSRHYRHVLASQLGTIKDRYALLVSTWRAPPDDLAAVAQAEGVASGELLALLTQPIELTRFEFSTSNIDTHTLRLACHLCANLNLSMTQLLECTARLSPARRARFMRRTGAADEALTADIMAVLTLVQEALISGDPLPAVLPTPLVSRAMQSSIRISRRDDANAANKASGSDGHSGDGAQQLDDDELSVRQHIAEEEGRTWVSALNGFLRVLGSADDLVLVIKGAVGETSRVDLDALDLERN
ncbi:hypothetical protein BX600DRAFT_507441 [Xylariales sp. PMI_506]|nr:hypothetical protein BX600DRAFT_507441 [Xylariales sp. PMI_506]